MEKKKIEMTELEQKLVNEITREFTEAINQKLEELSDVLSRFSCGSLPALKAIYDMIKPGTRGFYFASGGFKSLPEKLQERLKELALCRFLTKFEELQGQMEELQEQIEER